MPVIIGKNSFNQWPIVIPDATLANPGVMTPAQVAQLGAVGAPTFELTTGPDTLDPTATVSVTISTGVFDLIILPDYTGGANFIKRIWYAGSGTSIRVSANFLGGILVLEMATGNVGADLFWVEAGGGWGLIIGDFAKFSVT